MGNGLSGEGFELKADGGDVAPVRFVEGSRQEGVPWAREKKALMFESDESFANGDAGDAEGFGEAGFEDGDA